MENDGKLNKLQNKTVGLFIFLLLAPFLSAIIVNKMEASALIAFALLPIVYLVLFILGLINSIRLWRAKKNSGTILTILFILYIILFMTSGKFRLALMGIIS